MDSDCSIKEFIRDYSREVINSSTALFIGSGLSRSAGYTDWKGILKEAAEDIGLKVEKENDLISLAEYYVNNKKSRAKINSAISEYFSRDLAPTESHFILASLPITSYWTTNYDKLIENTLKKLNINYSFLTNDNSFGKFINGNSVVIHKLHGDVDTPNEAVITKKDYEEFAFKHEILLAKLKGEMCSKTFLFIGYSFNDTDINHILSRIRLFYRGNPVKSHYCILERIKKYNDINGNPENEEDFEYRKRKQEHHIVDLLSYGINTVLVDNYEEDIPKILKEIRKKVYSKNVFISGACEDVDVGKCAQYAKTISTWLITQNYRIYSGYGKNVGAEVVAGVDDACRLTRQHTIKNFNEQIHIYPFPYRKSMENVERKKIYSDLRRNIINNTQIAIIINGTKKERRKTVISDGILEEAHIALSQDCLVIPIGVTGGAAEQIWHEMQERDLHYTKTIDFELLNYGKSFEEVFGAVKRIIENRFKSE